MRKPIVRFGSLWLPGLLMFAGWTSPAAPLVTYQDLLGGLKNPTSWLTYSGDYSGQRHSPLKQITPENAGRLAAQWTFQTETMARGRGYEATPLLVDGVMDPPGPNDFA